MFDFGVVDIRSGYFRVIKMEVLGNSLIDTISFRSMVAIYPLT